MPPLYALTPRTAADVRRILQDGGSVGGRATSGAPARGITWVMVTWSPGSGWHNGVVSLDDSGTWSDLTDTVQVKAADGSALVVGQRYLCTRCGDASDGTARFVTTTPATASGFHARLTTASSGVWKWVPLTLTAGGVYVDDGSESATFNAYPLQTQGVGAVAVSAVEGRRVWMLPSKQAGKYEFLERPVVSGTAFHPTGASAYVPPSGLNTGISITLPVSGTYMVSYQVHGGRDAGGGGGAQALRAYLISSLTSDIVPGSMATVFNVPGGIGPGTGAGNVWRSTGAVRFRHVVTTPVIMTLWAQEFAAFGDCYLIDYDTGTGERIQIDYEWVG